MTALKKQALREAAIRAGGGNWIYIRTLSLSNAYITEETGATVINCTGGDVPAKCAGFLELANPATVLALLDEMEVAEKRIAELEARTVTLPGVEKWRSVDAVRAQNAYKVLVSKVLADAGIGVKGE